MNCTLTRATSAEVHTGSIHANFPPDSLLERNAYATAPMVAVLPPYQFPGEEELYTSFEEAISKRSSALSLNRIRYSNHSTAVAPDMAQRNRITQAHTIHNIPAMRRVQLLPASAWQRFIMLSGLALIFMLIGFDLMGLLILHTH